MIKGSWESILQILSSEYHHSHGCSELCIYKMTRNYLIRIEIPELDIDYTDTCEAENREEASKVFWMQLPEAMKSYWLYGILETYICTQEKKEFWESLEISK